MENGKRSAPALVAAAEDAGTSGAAASLPAIPAEAADAAADTEDASVADATVVRAGASPPRAATDTDG